MLGSVFASAILLSVFVSACRKVLTGTSDSSPQGDIYSARALHGFRVLTSLAILCLLFVDDVSGIAFIPSSLAKSWSMLSYLSLCLPHDLQLPFLEIFRLCAIVVALGVAVGFWGRTGALLQSLLFYLHYEALVGFTHFFHSGLIPLYLSFFLVFCPTGIKGRSGTVDRYVSALYCLYALPYVNAAVSKIAALPGWVENGNLVSLALSDSIVLREPSHIITWCLFECLNAPQCRSISQVIGLAVIAVELSPLFMVFSWRARRLVPILLGLLHLSIYILHGFAFFDLLILSLIGPICLSHRFGVVIAPCHRDKTTPLSRPAAICFSILLTAIVCGRLIQVERFPLLSRWSMYTEAPFSFHEYRFFVEHPDGTSEYLSPESLLSFLGQGRWRDFLSLAADNSLSEQTKLFIRSVLLARLQQQVAHHQDCLRVEFFTRTRWDRPNSTRVQSWRTCELSSRSDDARS